MEKMLKARVIAVDCPLDIGHVLAIDHTPLTDIAPALIGMHDYLIVGILSNTMLSIVGILYIVVLFLSKLAVFQIKTEIKH